MFYEVFIPSTDAEGYDVTMTVDADNWMTALKSGLQRTGEGADSIRNVMCDIKDDNTIHVTDATSRRVFVLREISEAEYEAAQSGEQPVIELDASAKKEAGDEVIELAPEAAKEAAPPPTPAKPVVEKKPEPAKPAVVAKAPESKPAKPKPAAKPEPKKAAASIIVDEGLEAGADHAWAADEGRMRIGSSTFEALRRDQPEPKVLRETRKKSDHKRPKVVVKEDDSAKVGETLLEDVFLEIQQIHEGSMAMEDVVNFVADMAVDKVGAESGSVLFADVNGRELYFATARGPKASEIMDFRVPMGQGIVGFCAREGVSLAIGDAQKDPRFYKKISEALGYETKSLACAPIQHEGRVYGAIELVNKKRASHFSNNELNVLSYIGRQLAQYVHNVIMAREKLDA